MGTEGFVGVHPVGLYTDKKSVHRGCSAYHVDHTKHCRVTVRAPRTSLHPHKRCIVQLQMRTRPERAQYQAQVAFPRAQPGGLCLLLLNADASNILLSITCALRGA